LEGLRGFLPRQLARPVGEKQHIDLTQGVLAQRPGHLLDLHPAAPALDTAHCVEQHHGETPDRNKLETALRQLIVAGRRTTAARAACLGAAPWAHIDLDGLGGFVEPRTLVDESGKVVTGVEQAGQKHLGWQGIDRSGADYACCAPGTGSAVPRSAELAAALALPGQ